MMLKTSHCASKNELGKLAAQISQYQLTKYLKGELSIPQFEARST